MTSDAHEGLKKAIAQILAGTPWQRCRVHFMRNILAKVPKSAQQEVATAVRSVFAQPDMASAREQLHRVAARLAGYPKARALLLEAEDDILAHMALPESHRRRMQRAANSASGTRDLCGEFRDLMQLWRLWAVTEGSFPGRWASTMLPSAPAATAACQATVSRTACMASSLCACPRDRWHRVVFSSFNLRALVQLRRLHPGYHLGLLTAAGMRHGQATARLVRATAVRRYAAEASPSAIARWRESGFGVVVWGDRDAGELTGLTGLDVDAMITGRVKEAVDRLAARRA